MAKQLTKQSLHSWAVYHIEVAPANLVGIVDDQPDPAAARSVGRGIDLAQNSRGQWRYIGNAFLFRLAGSQAVPDLAPLYQPLVGTATFVIQQGRPVAA